LELNETGKLHRIIDQGQPQYVGPPTPEIDAAWDKLMLGKKTLLGCRPVWVC
jgi:hypothetical protein